MPKSAITLERICELESLFQRDEITSHHIREMLDELGAAIREDRAEMVSEAQVEAFCIAMGCTGNHNYKRSVRNALQAARKARAG